MKREGLMRQGVKRKLGVLVLYVLCMLMVSACTMEPAQSAPAGLDAQQKEESDAMGSIIMPGQKGWGIGGKLQVQNPSRTVGLRADFRTAPGMYTLQFGIERPGNYPGFLPNRAVVSIEWTVNGITVLREVSVGEGVSISGCGEAVLAVVRDITTASPVIVSPPEYNVTISLTPGTRPSASRPPVLIPPDTPGPLPFSWQNGRTFVAAATSSPSASIPANAGAISINVIVDSNPQTGIGDSAVIVSDVAGIIVYQYDPILYQGFQPLPPGSASFVVQNFAAAQPFFVSAQLGIDG